IKEISYYLNKSIDIKNDLLVFDEIQNAPKALTSLKYFNEEIPELDIACAGSLLGLYLGEYSFPVGKIEILEMHPVNFFEFLNALEEFQLLDYLNSINKNNFKEKKSDVLHYKLWNLLKLYFVVGGLPKSVSIFREYRKRELEALKNVRKYQKDMVVSYMADVAKHSGKVNSMHIERIWSSVASKLQSEHDGSAPKFIFSDVLEKNSRYSNLKGAIDWLSTCGLILKCPIVNTSKIPLSAYTKENIFKLFFFDIGLLGAISELNPELIMDYDYGSYKGYFAENFVIQELNSKGFKLYNWRERTSEVEFLLEHNKSIYPLEVKSGWITQAKSLDVYKHQYNPKNLIITSAKNFAFMQEKILLPLYSIYNLEAFL
ncbi:MAG: DUF4143 domain-containing protein, partial [Candidatus Pacebacteria bacterium]|nr:DUF4143 domain-containing protein [Candidatus Paceibacterota bacterium]